MLAFSWELLVTGGILEKIEVSYLSFIVKFYFYAQSLLTFYSEVEILNLKDLYIAKILLMLSELIKFHLNKN